MLSEIYFEIKQKGEVDGDMGQLRLTMSRWLLKLCPGIWEFIINSVYFC